MRDTFLAARRAGSGIAALVLMSLAVLSLAVGCEGADDSFGSCSCSKLAGRLDNTYRCQASDLNSTEYLCEVGDDGTAFNCAIPGSSPELFSTAGLGCEPGFCRSSDGTNCDAICSCSN